MKYLIVIFFLFTCFSSFAQQSQGNDTSKYVWYKYQYGSRMPRYQADSVLNTPKDTTYSKTGIARKGTYFYVGNGTYWTLVNSSTQTNYNSIDSATTTGNEVCLWSLGVPFVCFTINSTPGDTTIAGLDSVIVQGNLLCQWKAGVSTCYTISNTIINNTNNYITNVYTGVDSVVVSGTNLCQWSGGIATCYTISTTPGDTTISGIDSVTIQGSQLCQWKAGVSTCYTVTNTINNSSVTNYIDSSITNVYNYLDSSTVIINSGSGLDSIRINGYQICFYLHDSASPRCWQLNTFFDDVRLSDDSTLYEFYNGDSLVKTVPSGIKNVGAVWPLSYNGVDLTTSKPFNDSLYLSSLVKHSDSLFSKKLTGDSVFVGLMSGSGGSSSGIDSMYVTSDSLYQVFIYSSGRRDSVGYSGSSSSSSLTLKYTTNGYGISVDSATTNLYRVIADTTLLASQARLTAMLATKLNITDTTNKWVQDIRKNATNDSFIVYKNGIRSAYKDNSGSTYIDSAYYVGELYNKTSWTSLSDFTNNAATVSVVSNKLQFSGGANNFVQTEDLSSVYLYENWSFQAGFKADTKNATSYGFGIGIRSMGTPNVSIKFDATNTGTSGTLSLYNSVNTLITSSTTLVSFTAGDSIVLTLQKSNGGVFATAYNYTTRSAKAVLNYTFIGLATGNPLLHNTGRYSIYSFGGQFTVYSMQVSSKDIVNADLMLIGDSKAQAYDAGDYNNTYSSLLRSKYKNVAISGGQGDRTLEVLAKLPQIIAQFPKVVMLAIGSNDIRAGRAYLSYTVDYDSITRALTNAGIRVIHLLPFYETAVNVDSLKAYILATYSSSNIIDTYTPLKASGALSATGVHPSYLGHTYIFDAIESSNKWVGKPNQTIAAPNGLLYGNYAGGLTSGTGPTYDPVLLQLGVGTKARMGTNGLGYGTLDLNGQDISSASVAHDLIRISNDLYISRPTGGNLYLREHNTVQMSFAPTTGNLTILGKTFIGSTSLTPTARLHLLGGTNVAANAPFKINYNSLATTAASGTGTIATITFAAQTVAPFIAGSKIVVANVTPSGYNGTYTVLTCNTTTVTYASATTGSQTVAGTVSQLSLLDTPEPGAFEYDGINYYITDRAGTRRILTMMDFGTAAPATTPTANGTFFLDTTNKKLYVATGTASSADWTILN